MFFVLAVEVLKVVVLYNYVNATRPVIGRCPYLLEYRYMDNGSLFCSTWLAVLKMFCGIISA